MAVEKNCGNYQVKLSDPPPEPQPYKYIRIEGKVVVAYLRYKEGCQVGMPPTEQIALSQMVSDSSKDLTIGFLPSQRSFEELVAVVKTHANSSRPDRIRFIPVDAFDDPNEVLDYLMQNRFGHNPY